MKITEVLRIMATLVIGLVPIGGLAQIQTYHYSGAVNGWADVDLSPSGLGAGGFEATFGALSETLYYNPTAGTLEQVGSVTVNSSSAPVNIQGSIFAPGEGSATLTVGNNGSVSFDDIFTGVSLGGPETGTTMLVPISASGVYDGRAFTGNWDIDIQNYLTIDAVGPTSLTFSEASLDSFSAGQGVSVVSGTDLRDATSDDTYYYSWDVDALAVTAVPDEANSLALLGLGLSALALFRRR
ncbi:MAG: hypothetical protein ABSA83_01585 [Verrucomicrobiota bacterium]|jgi:hypothetical protein